MSAIIASVVKAGFPLGFLIFGLYLIHKSKAPSTKKYLFWTVIIGMVFGGGAMIKDQGNCSPWQFLAISNSFTCK